MRAATQRPSMCKKPLHNKNSARRPFERELAVQTVRKRREILLRNCKGGFYHCAKKFLFDMITAHFYNSLGWKDGIIFISQLSTACFLISWGSWRLWHGATCCVPPTRKVESQTGLLLLRVKGVSFSCFPWSQRFSKTKVLKSTTSLLLWAQKVLIFIGWFV